jgi:hypothetical protein
MDAYASGYIGTGFFLTMVNIFVSVACDDVGTPTDKDANGNIFPFRVKINGVSPGSTVMVPR